MDSARPGGPLKLFTVDDAALKLGVSVAAFKDWAEENEVIPHVTPDGSKAYTEDDLKQFIQENSLFAHFTLFPPKKSKTMSGGKPGRAINVTEERLGHVDTSS